MRTSTSSSTSGLTTATSFLLICCLLLPQLVSSFPKCDHSQADELVTNCKHGLVEDFCGRLICGQGPGELCGGSWRHLGTCGNGMYCACQRCSGCSMDSLECYNEYCM